MASVEVPSFEFSSFYYQDILQALLLYKRKYVPELTDESDFEPFTQFLRSNALVGHLNNVLVDLVANESTLPTARLADTIRNMLRLIAYELKPATPSGVLMLYELRSVLTSTVTIVPGGSLAATQRGTADTFVIPFETISGVSCERTDLFGAVFAKNPDGSFEDHTSDANTGTPFLIWSDPVAPGSELYFGHVDALWDVLDLEVTATGAITIGAWEFWDGNVNDTKPTSVANAGGGILQFNVNSLLGNSKRSGAVVTVTVARTGVFEEVVSSWNGSENVVQTGFLSQTTPSIDENDYVIGVKWQELTNTDGTAALSASAQVTYALPQNETQDWKRTEVNVFEGYFIRFRVIEVNNSVSPTLGRCRMDLGGQYVVSNAVQGRSIKNEILGSSNGEPNQRFKMGQPNFILNSDEVFIDAVQWTRVTDFLGSQPQDTHYRVELGTDNRGFVVFGDGVTGKIPPIGQANVAIDYRHDAKNNGNVGARTIIVDKTGLTYVNSLTNPRSAAGWAAAQSESAEGLERAKVEGPASVRTRDVAIGPDDAERLAVAFVDPNGSKPFVRVKAVEEGFGPKTMKMVCVAKGGVQPTTQQLEDLDLYFNGNRNVDPPTPKRIVANQQAISIGFTPRPVSVTAIVEAPSTVLPQQVVNHLAEVFHPEAVKDDGLTYLWNFGDEIPIARILHEIFETDPRITDALITSPLVPIQLTGEELPTKGTFAITIVKVL